MLRPVAWAKVLLVVEMFKQVREVVREADLPPGTIIQTEAAKDSFKATGGGASDAQNRAFAVRIGTRRTPTLLPSCTMRRTVRRASRAREGSPDHRDAEPR